MSQVIKKKHKSRNLLVSTLSILKQVLLYSLIFLFAIVMIMPFLWMVLTAFKMPNEVITYPLKWLPSKFNFSNFPEAFSKAPFIRYYLNSIFVVVTVTLSTLFFTSLSGFAFAKYKFVGKNFLFLLILSGMMIPFQVQMIPIYLFLNRLNWIDTYQALILPFAVSAYGVFLMRQFIQEIPDDLLGAARIDGCSESRIFFTVILPLCKAPLAALTIITFTSQWNSFLWPLIVIDTDNLRTVQLGLALFQSDRGILQYNLVMAITLVIILPVLIVFLSVQKYFTRGIALTGLKA